MKKLSSKKRLLNYKPSLSVIPENLTLIYKQCNSCSAYYILQDLICVFSSFSNRFICDNCIVKSI